MSFLSRLLVKNVLTPAGVQMPPEPAFQVVGSSTLSVIVTDSPGVATVITLSAAIGAGSGNNGQMYVINSFGQPAWLTGSGDVSVSVSSTENFKVIGLQGHPLPIPTSTNTVIEWTGSALVWTPVSSASPAPSNLGPKSNQTLANGNNDNEAWGGLGVIRIDITGPTASCALRGIAGGADGQVLELWFNYNQQTTLSNLSSGSLPGNRFQTPTGVDTVMPAPGATSGHSIPYNYARLVYELDVDGGNGGWRVS